jgi:hypothetical protein
MVRGREKVYIRVHNKPKLTTNNNRRHGQLESLSGLARWLVQRLLRRAASITPDRAFSLLAGFLDLYCRAYPGETLNVALNRIDFEQVERILSIPGSLSMNTLAALVYAARKQ